MNNIKNDLWILIDRVIAKHPATIELINALAELTGEIFSVRYIDSFCLSIKNSLLMLLDESGEEVKIPKLVHARINSGSSTIHKEITFLRHLELMGCHIINSIPAMLKCHNKFWPLQNLAKAGISVPDTIICPTMSLKQAVNIPGLPEQNVVKSIQGHRGKQVFLSPSSDFLKDIYGSLCQQKPFLFQAYIKESHGTDLRVVIVDGKIIGVKQRKATSTSVKSNLHQGGIGVLCQGKYPKAEKLALEIADTIGLKISGIDLLFCKDEAFIVCEVNANPAWENMPEVEEALASFLVSSVGTSRPNALV